VAKNKRTKNGKQSNDNPRALAAQLSERLYLRSLQGGDEDDAALARLADALYLAIAGRDRGEAVDRAALQRSAKVLGDGLTERMGLRRPPLRGEHTERVRRLADVAAFLIARRPSEHANNAAELVCMCVLSLGILHRDPDEMQQARDEVAAKLRRAHRNGGAEPDVVARWVLMAVGVTESVAKGWTKGAI
jgi:hypothetical protein